MKKIIPINDRKFIFYILTIVLSFGTFLFVYNNSFLYDNTVVKVIENHSSSNEQNLKCLVQNGDHKGEYVGLKNTFDYSRAYKEKYHKGNFLIIDFENKTIITQKRDYYIAFMILLLINLLIFVGKGKGLYTIFGLIFNCILYFTGIQLYKAGMSPILMLGILTIFFTVVILLPLNGAGKESLSAILSTLATLLTIGIFVYVIVLLAPRISYEFMDYLPEPYSLREANLLYISEILMAALGAIIDISVTITSSTAELLRRNPSLMQKDIMKSVFAISDDITGLMINVVFFTNIAGILPIFAISMKNDIEFITVLKNQAFFPVSRFLIGAIGIVLTIPLSAYIASKMLKTTDKGGADN